MLPLLLCLLALFASSFAQVDPALPCNVCSGDADLPLLSLSFKYTAGPGGFYESFRVISGGALVQLSSAPVGVGQEFRLGDGQSLGELLLIKIWSLDGAGTFSVREVELRVCDLTAPSDDIRVPDSSHVLQLLSSDPSCPAGPVATLRPTLRPTPAPTLDPVPECTICEGDRASYLHLQYKCDDLGVTLPGIPSLCGAVVEVYQVLPNSPPEVLFKQNVASDDLLVISRVDGSPLSGDIRLRVLSVLGPIFQPTEDIVEFSPICEELRPGLSFGERSSVHTFVLQCPPDTETPRPTPAPPAPLCDVAYAAPLDRGMVRQQCFLSLSPDFGDRWGWSVPSPPEKAAPVRLPIYAKALDCDVDGGLRVGSVEVLRTGLSSLQLNFREELRSWSFKEVHVLMGETALPFGAEVPPLRSVWKGTREEALNQDIRVELNGRQADFLIAYVAGGTSDCVIEDDLPVVECNMCADGVQPSIIFMRYEGQANTEVFISVGAFGFEVEISSRPLSPGDMFFVELPQVAGITASDLFLTFLEPSGELSEPMSLSVDCSQVLNTGRVLSLPNSQAVVILEGDNARCPVPGIEPPSPGNECDLCGTGREPPTSIYLESLFDQPVLVEVFQVLDRGSQLLTVEYLAPNELLRVHNALCDPTVDGDCSLGPQLQLRIEIPSGLAAQGVSIKLITTCDGFDVPPLTTGTILDAPGFPAALRVAGDDAYCPVGLVTLPPATSSPPADPCGDLCANGEIPLRLFLQAHDVPSQRYYVEFLKESPLPVLLPPSVLASGTLEQSAIFDLQDSGLVCDLLSSPKQFISLGCQIGPKLEIQVWDSSRKGRLIASEAFDTSCVDEPLHAGMPLQVGSVASFLILGEQPECPTLVPPTSTTPTTTATLQPCELCNNGEPPSTLAVAYTGPDSSAYARFVRVRQRSSQIVGRGTLRESRVFNLWAAGDDLAPAIEIRVWTSAARRQLVGEVTFPITCGLGELYAGLEVRIPNTEHSFIVLGDKECLSTTSTRVTPSPTVSTTTTTTTLIGSPPTPKPTPPACNLCVKGSLSDIIYLEYTRGDAQDVRFVSSSGAILFDSTLRSQDVVAVDVRGTAQVLVVLGSGERTLIDTSCASDRGLLQDTVFRVGAVVFTVKGSNGACPFVTTRTLSTATTAPATTGPIVYDDECRCDLCRLGSLSGALFLELSEGEARVVQFGATDVAMSVGDIRLQEVDSNGSVEIIVLNPDGSALDASELTLSCADSDIPIYRGAEIHTSDGAFAFKVKGSQGGLCPFDPNPVAGSGGASSTEPACIPRSSQERLSGAGIFGVVLGVVLVSGAAVAAIIFTMRYVRGQGVQAEPNPLKSEPEEALEVNDLM